MPNDWFKFTGKKEGQPSQDCVRVLGSLSSQVSSVSPITPSLGRLLRRQMPGHLLLIPPQELGCVGLDRQPRQSIVWCPQSACVSCVGTEAYILWCDENARKLRRLTN